MLLSRRAFTAGAAGLLATPRALAATGSDSSKRAIAAISAYAEAHRRHFDLPGLTLALTDPSGLSLVRHFGHANRDNRRPITDTTLFQIGSISKVMLAVLLHQFAAAGRLRLDDRLMALMPDLPLPRDAPITVQHVIDHVSGLPGNAPMFPEGGLWLAYAPGEHWHYSNTGYTILGRLAEQIGGKPLAQLYQERLFAPLGMTQSRGAITWRDRPLYAQGYEAADIASPYVLGEPLAPAAWVDVTFGAGSVASTSADMIRFMRSLADAAAGRGGLGLSPAHGRAFTSHWVQADVPEARYGNGLRLVKDTSGRAYLHHTGGMVSFSSAFHVDPLSGAGAFASSTVSAFHAYRPRKLTLFAVEALNAARAGKPIPAPPALAEPAATNLRDYAGRYAAGPVPFTVTPGPSLTIAADGKTAPLVAAGTDIFRTAHPAFRIFELKFERSGGKVVAASWGPSTYLREGAGGTLPTSDPGLARLAGRYVNDSPWVGLIPVVERGGKLWIGTHTPLVPIGPNLWRAGDEGWSPERVAFADFIDGRPDTLLVSGERYVRHDI